MHISTASSALLPTTLCTYVEGVPVNRSWCIDNMVVLQSGQRYLTYMLGLVHVKNRFVQNNLCSKKLPDPRPLVDITNIEWKALMLHQMPKEIR